ncbi:MAG: hypothetical protein JNL58_30695 [Planctomyces sp.]|nr:hypothetical protein [Planctomyces sp.]
MADGLSWERGTTGVWEEDQAAVVSSSHQPHQLPNLPWSLTASGLIGVFSTTPSRNFGGPAASVGGSGSSTVGIHDSPIRLPIPLLRYQLQQQEFVFIPDAPPSELLHPS